MSARSSVLVLLPSVAGALARDPDRSDARCDDVERGGLDEKVARETIKERIKAFEEVVESESAVASPRSAASRSAQERRQATGRSGRVPAGLPRGPRRAAPPGPATGPSSRHAADGKRRSAARPTRYPSYGPVLARDRRRPDGDELQAPQAAQAGARGVVRVSGSVASFAHFTLLLTHRAARAVLQGEGALPSSTPTDEVTEFFERGGESSMRSPGCRGSRHRVVRRPQRLRPLLRGLRAAVA